MKFWFLILFGLSNIEGKKNNFDFKPFTYFIKTLMLNYFLVTNHVMIEKQIFPE